MYQIVFFLIADRHSVETGAFPDFVPLPPHTSAAQQVYHFPFGVSFLIASIDFTLSL